MLALPLRRRMQDDDNGEGYQQRDQHEFRVPRERRLRQDQSTAVEKRATWQLQAVAKLRQRFQNGVIPEQQMEQQRDITDDPDVTLRQLRDQPVVRQLTDADDKADDCRQRYAEDRNQKGIQKPDPERPQVR